MCFLYQQSRNSQEQSSLWDLRGTDSHIHIQPHQYPIWGTPAMTHKPSDSITITEFHFSFTVITMLGGLLIYGNIVIF